MAQGRKGTKGSGRKSAPRGGAPKGGERQAGRRAQEEGAAATKGRHQPADDKPEAAKAGRIVVVATPIGNLGDLSPRAIKALLEADLVVAEDTRVAAVLLSKHQIRKPVTRLDEHATDTKLRTVVDAALSGQTVALTTDAGTPGISDPGTALLDLAHQAGLPVDSVPGPSAVTNALALSGFYAQRYAFLGFLPRKAGSLQAEFEPYKDSPTTLVFFESPHRVQKALAAALSALGDRRACVCREMTKMHQEVVRARLSELVEAALVSKGEYTVVLEGRRRRDSDG